jgi:hypothetical protein
MNPVNISKWLIFTGIGIIFAGVLVWGLAKLGISIGKLPGDIALKKEKFGIYFPIVSSIILSIILTIAVNFFLWLFRK